MTVRPITVDHMASADSHVEKAVAWLEGTSERPPGASVRNALRLLHLQLLSGGSAKITLTFDERINAELSTGT